ncbi:MAG: magnesium transporter [Clostridia bacterium]|nr:magnesium transporter [Clostridia bacterium]
MNKHALTPNPTPADETVGAYMSANYIALPQGASVREAMRRLVGQAAEYDNIATLFLIDDFGRLLGTLELKDLIIAREGTALESLADPNFPYVFADEPLPEAMERLRDAELSSVPVLEESGLLCGVLLPQDLAEFREEALEADYARLAALSPEEETRDGVLAAVGRRLPWLTVLLGLGLAVSAVAGLFNRVAAEFSLLISFQSLILGMAGNAGTQSLAVTIRELSEDSGAGLSFLWREVRVGLAGGVALGLLSVLFIGGGLALFSAHGAALSFSVGLCAGLSLALSILLSSLCGAAVPLLFYRLGVDPAVASGPLITTASDLVAIVTYYGSAALLLARFAG